MTFQGTIMSGMVAITRIDAAAVSRAGKRLKSLIGAARAAMALGNDERWSAIYAALVQVGVRESERPGLQEGFGDMEASTR
jgi:hypothetical protein